MAAAELSRASKAKRAATQHDANRSRTTARFSPTPASRRRIRQRRHRPTQGIRDIPAPVKGLHGPPATCFVIDVAVSWPGLRASDMYSISSRLSFVDPVGESEAAVLQDRSLAAETNAREATGAHRSAFGILRHEPDQEDHDGQGDGSTEEFVTWFCVTVQTP